MKRVLIFIGLGVIEISAFVGVVWLLIWGLANNVWWVKWPVFVVVGGYLCSVFCLLCVANWRKAGELAGKEKE